jgi:hypothetical protein
VKDNKGMRFELFENVWIVNNIREERLNNVFLPIHEMVLGMAQMKLFNWHQKLVDENIRVLGFKTDAIFFEKTNKPVEKCKTLLSSLTKSEDVELLMIDYPLHTLWKESKRENFRLRFQKLSLK